MLSAVLSGGVDFEKLRKFCEQRDVEILVGFPAGRMHVDTTHKIAKKKDGTPRTDKYGNIKRETGNDVTQETAELAKRLYFGDAHTPARPFLSDGIAQNKNELRQVLETEAAKDQPNWRKVGKKQSEQSRSLLEATITKRTYQTALQRLRRKAATCRS